MIQEYRKYEAAELGKLPAEDYMDAVAESVGTLGFATATKASPRSIRVAYADQSLNRVCHICVTRRENRGHFGVKVTIIMEDGSKANEFCYRDIVADELSGIVRGITSDIRDRYTGWKSGKELERFRTTVEKGFNAAGYRTECNTSTVMCFSGNSTEITVTVDELGSFTGIARKTRSRGTMPSVFKTTGTATRENGEKLVERFNSL